MNAKKSQKIFTPKDHPHLKREAHYKNGIFSLEADVVIIGSGAGGAVAAAELARSGQSVIVLEEGPFLTNQDYSHDEFATLSRTYRDGAYVSSEDFSIHVLQGRVIGGSTTINWQTCIYPSLATTTEWEKDFGLQGYSQKEMAPYIAEVEKRISATKVPLNMINMNNRLLMEGAEKIGIPYKINYNNSSGCTGLGRCGLGCPTDAKRSAALTFLPDALGHGAKVFSCVRAEEIIDGPVKRVVARYAPDPDSGEGEQENPGDVIETFEFRAKKVIVCAGAIESPALLQRSGLGNSFVGQRLKLHPTTTLLARYSQPVEMFYGTPQSVVIDEFANLGTGYGYLLEVAPYRPTIASLVIPFYGEKAFQVMENYSHLQAGIVIVRDGSGKELEASIEYSGGQRKLHFKLTSSDAANMLQGIRTFASIQAAAGAKEIIFPFTRFKEPYKVKPGETFNWVLQEKRDVGDILLGSAHPHGSVQAAASSKDGALSPDFELYGHKGIYVMDGSWMPTAIGVNPQILVMSAAMRAVRKLV